MRDFLVYLAGPITGLTYEQSTEWREYATAAFPSSIQGISPMRGRRYLQSSGITLGRNETFASLPIAKARAIQARSKFDVLRSDALLVNLLGASSVSIGAVLAAGWANLANVPVIAAMEPGGMNPHDHVMFTECMDFIYYGLDEAIEGVCQILCPHEKFMHNRLNMVRLLREENRLDLQSPPPPEP